MGRILRRRQMVKNQTILKQTDKSNSYYNLRLFAATGEETLLFRPTKAGLDVAYWVFMAVDPKVRMFVRGNLASL